MFALAERADTLPLFLLYSYTYINSEWKGKPSSPIYLWSGDWVSWEQPHDPNILYLWSGDWVSWEYEM
jgi:hypothetical protein